MEPTAFQAAFLRRLGNLQQVLKLLDSLPDVAFFIKDRQSRFVMNNLHGAERCGTASEEPTIGKVGHEFFAPDRMAIYLEQDRQVMETGRPILNALCPAPEKGVDQLIVYSKVPLTDRRGRVIGLAGLYRNVALVPDKASPLGPIARVVARIHRDFAEPLKVAGLAAEASLSRSQLDRQFRDRFGTTPREYLLRVRVHEACRLLLETDRKTVAIALDTGFYDHSHFSRTFRRIMGIGPQAFRRRHAAQRMLPDSPTAEIRISKEGRGTKSESADTNRR